METNLHRPRRAEARAESRLCLLLLRLLLQLPPLPLQPRRALPCPSPSVEDHLAASPRLLCRELQEGPALDPATCPEEEAATLLAQTPRHLQAHQQAQCLRLRLRQHLRGPRQLLPLLLLQPLPLQHGLP